NIWEERIVKDDGCKEPKKAFIYFQEYLNLGVGRKLSKVAENTGKTDRYIKKLSYTWDWTERASVYDISLMEENKREFEEETRERYRLANNVALQALHVAIDELKKEPSLRNAKMAGDLAAKLLMKESSVNTKMEVEQKSLTFNSTGKGDLATAVREAFGLKPREQVLDEKEERNKKIKENNDFDDDLYEDDFIEAQIIEEKEKEEEE
ncbi:MAG: hypothetical protein MJ224_07860, partial [archaeon]|nr:hypothetical protein [archaeon]